MKLVIPKEYPNAPPRGFFLTKIYHPNVADNGDICVNTLKKDWTTEVTLKHIFQVIRCLLIVPFPESSLNCEAGKHAVTSPLYFIILIIYLLDMKKCTDIFLDNCFYREVIYGKL